MADGGGNAPRGRGAFLLALIEKKKREQAEKQVGRHEEVPLEHEPRKPVGRAEALRRKLQASKVGSGGDSGTSASASSSKTRIEEVTKELAQVSVSSAEPDVERSPVTFRGETGRPIPLSSNYLKLDVEKERGFFQYEVIFETPVDSKSSRIKVVRQCLSEFDTTRVFDGGSLLYLPSKIIEGSRQFTTSLDDGQKFVITIKYKRQKNFGDSDCLHLYNTLFKRIMRILEYTQMGRNYFNTNQRQMIPQHKLEVYPGFAVSVDEQEGGLMLCLDTQHRVLRTQNALEMLQELKNTVDPKHFRETAQNNLIGSAVLTRYNNKTYIIHDVSWNITPRDTFPTRDGGEISFLDYYKTHYNIVIKDQSQPMLLHRKQVKTTDNEPEDRLILLIPELTHLTGLTDSMRNDFRVMKDVTAFLRVTPQQRLFAMKKYVENVNSSEKAQMVLKGWGLTLSSNSLRLPGRQMDTEMIVFRDTTKSAGPQADWNRELQNNAVSSPVDIANWIVFFTERDSNCARDFVQHMTRMAKSLGCEIRQPRMEKLPNDATATYVNAIKSKISPNDQIAVFICPSIRSDRYSTIKKLCSTDMKTIPTQVINSRTLSKPDKVRSIVLKIALQMECKLGGSLWTLKFPFNGWMICGIDVYHGGKESVCGFVSSTDNTVSRWFSKASYQKHEIGDFLKKVFVEAMKRYQRENCQYPKKVVVIRDGVGDGQLEPTKRYEVSQIESVLNELQFDTQLCYVIVQKRINTRMFSVQSGAPENPPPGTVLDHTITRRYLHDFFLVPQSVRQGTVNPTHYVVLHDTCNIKPDHVQRLCYKLCHLYYNWPGTIRVPAPCQYAHKLAAMVGQNVKDDPAIALSDKLWYL